MRQLLSSLRQDLGFFFFFFFCFPPRARNLHSLTTQKSRRAEKKFHNARSLQENLVRSAASQSTRTIVAI